MEPRVASMRGRPIREDRGHAPLGVGRGLPASPSLRTGLADLPHPALQLVVLFGIDAYTWDLRLGERSLTCWQFLPLCHQSPSTPVAPRLDAYEHGLLVALVFLASRQYTIPVFPLRFRSTFLPPFAPRPLQRFSAPMEAQSPVCLSLAQLRGSPIHHT